MTHDLRGVFNKRAEKLNDHDPWRYGAALSLKTDLVELEWVRAHMEGQTLLDAGCGTGRHCIELATAHPAMHFYGFDFAEHTIRIFKEKLAEAQLTNVDARVCGVEHMSETYKGETFDNILSIGLLQYLDDGQLDAHLRDCHALLNPDGVLMVKHPTAYHETFTFDGYSDLLESRYVSIYRNFQDLIEAVHPYFDIEMIEPTFTLRSLAPEEFAAVERQADTRQMWFLLRRRERVLPRE